MKYFQNRKLIPLSIFLTLYLLVLVPLIVFNLQQRQDPRSKAQVTQNTTATTNLAADTCANTPADIVLVMDRSTSMEGKKIADAKVAAKLFVDIIAQQNNGARVALVTYAGTATTNTGLTTNYSSVKTAIDRITLSSHTCIQCGVDKALQTFAQNPGTVKKVTILLTDGLANTVNGSRVSESTAEQATLTAVKNGIKMPYFTIGLGSDVNTSLLQTIASITGAKYYFPPTPDALNAIYTDISTLYGKGSVTGYVFNDANNNGAHDTNEPRLQGWTVQITKNGTTATKSTTTDNQGLYYFGGLCDGTYAVTEILQRGWRQTLPANGAAHTVLIDKANAVTDKNFGNNNTPPTTTPTYVPTPTFTPSPTPTYPPTPTPTYPPSPTPTYKPTATPSPTYPPSPTVTNAPTAYPTQGLTSFALTVFQHGIGTSGDNTNPEGSLSNKNPQHKTINAELQLYDIQNNMYGAGTGQVTYDPKTGAYKGTIGIFPNQFISGKYTLKVRTERHLTKLMDGVQTIKAGEHNDSLPAVTLVTGDVNNNNQINILDYNMLLDCYSDLVTASNCQQPGKKVAADLNDDGPVNQIDYNLFLREIATQPGS